MMTRKAICLFSSAGIGELGLVANGIEIIISNELLKNRHDLYQANYPKTKCVLGDIWEEKKNILDYYHAVSRNEELFLVYATPPCQGMSSNGAGKLKHEVNQGRRQAIDERNRLIIPTMDIVSQVRPQWVLLENVPGMQYTSIHDENGESVNIMDYIQRRLGPAYVGKGEVVSCADYGIPQTRKRLITIYTRTPQGIEYFRANENSFFPAGEKSKKITLREAIGSLPRLDARAGYERAEHFHPLHYVPLMKEEKHWWVSNTPEGNTAYNNQCVNADCRHNSNPLHRDVQSDGRWHSNKNTPIHCVKCGQLLPRPSMIDKKTGKRRLLKGFHSAYRRMEWDKPANALTQNYQFEASDNKIHPDQNRVLSIYEALVIQTIADYKYHFELNGQRISRSLFAEIIGESVPPKLIDVICDKMIAVTGGKCSGHPDIKTGRLELKSDKKRKRIQECA